MKKANLGYNLQRLRTGLKPYRLHWFTRLRSTSDHAAAMRKRGDLFAPAVILAGRQTAGRGRGGNQWWSAGGCLTVTFALPIEEHLAVHQLALVTGLAVRNAAAELTGRQEIGLKWPNDILHQGRKLAGLLCERINHVDLIGIGLNLSLDPASIPQSLVGRITCLATIAQRAMDPTECLLAIAKHMRLALRHRSEKTFAAIVQEYDRWHVLNGQQVRVLTGAPGEVIQGSCLGLDEVGRLRLRDGNRVHRIMAGHVELA